VAAEFANSDERGALAGFLDWQRAALIRKVRGISDADARRAPTASSLTLLGLIKHSTVWEARWFEGVVAGRALADGWPDTEHDVQDGSDFSVGDDDAVEEWVARYEDAIATAREIVAGADLDARVARADVVDANVRFVVVHMIEETARHAGHADIIRETIDGTRGK
jgi:hypothetical protein